MLLIVCIFFTRCQKMPPTKEYVFSRQTLADVVGCEANTITQHIGRGYVNPTDLKSVALYLAHYGPQELREQIVAAAIRRPTTLDPGGWKKRRRKSKKMPT
jgi:hypothetical protein